MAKDIFERIFGKRPKKGYKFTSVEVELVDNSTFKGFSLNWCAKGIGFGQVFVGWGIDAERLRDCPHQQGFYSDTEYMSDEFVHALMKEAAPQIATLICKNDVHPNL